MKRISMLVRIVAWVLPAIAASCGAVSAQTVDGGFDRVLAPGGPSLQIGPYAGITYSLHSGSFVTTEHNIVCCEFNEGRGFGPAAGIAMSLSLDEAFFVRPSIGYEERGGTFASEPQRLPFFGRNNEMETMTFQSTLEVSLATLDVEALAGYRIGETGLYLAAGPSMSVVLSQHESKSERIVDPAGVKYLDGTTEKSLYDGDMELVRPTLFSARAGIGASIEIAEGMALTPEVLYSLPLGAASRSDEWSVAGVHATLGLLFEL
jgi:hypothetical protein